MKQWIAGLIACALLLSGAGMADVVEKEQLSVTLAEMMDANDVTRVLESTKGVRVDAVYYDETGRESFSLTTYAYMVGGTPRYATEDSDGNVCVIGGGEGCGYDAKLGGAYVVAYIDGAYETEMLDTADTFFLNIDGDESIVRDEATDEGRLMVVTEEAIDGKGYSGHDGCTLVTRHVLNAETLELEELYESVRGGDGVETPLCKALVTRDVVYALPDALKAIGGDDVPMREVYIIRDHGTANETTYAVELPAAALMQAALPEGWSLYADAACTLPSEEAKADATGAVVTYMARNP